MLWAIAESLCPHHFSCGTYFFPELCTDGWTPSSQPHPLAHLVFLSSCSARVHTGKLTRRRQSPLWSQSIYSTNWVTTLGLMGTGTPSSASLLLWLSVRWLGAQFGGYFLCSCLAQALGQRLSQFTCFMPSKSLTGGFGRPGGEVVHGASGGVMSGGGVALEGSARKRGVTWGPLRRSGGLVWSPVWAGVGLGMTEMMQRLGQKRIKTWRSQVLLEPSRGLV